jgi:DNA-binding LytR/AlgR family response regulator
MKSAPPELRSVVRGLGVAVAAGVVLSLTGAFGSIAAPLEARLAYWVPVMILGGLWGHLCSVMIDRLINLDERPWLQVAALTLVISGPLVVLVWAATGLAFAGRLYAPTAMGQLVVPVLVITAVISAINVFTGRRAQPVQTHQAPADRQAARFPARLPPRLRGAAIQAVQAEDHYLRIHTDRGSDLILMRLSDALEELEGLEGAQTHRSWWVARDAVRDIQRGDGRAALTLVGGVVAPVSRRYARALREAGWY